jgi:hypothetical protein
MYLQHCSLAFTAITGVTVDGNSAAGEASHFFCARVCFCPEFHSHQCVAQASVSVCVEAYAFMLLWSIFLCKWLLISVLSPAVKRSIGCCCIVAGNGGGLSVMLGNDDLASASTLDLFTISASSNHAGAVLQPCLT